MLKSLRLINFKAFQDQTLLLRPLTLLTGMNGMGKSSVIQALLLLRQSSQINQSSLRGHISRLALNGPLVQLGTGRDVFFEGATSNTIGIHLEAEIKIHEYGPDYTTPTSGTTHHDFDFVYDRDTNSLYADYQLEEPYVSQDIAETANNGEWLSSTHINEPTLFEEYGFQYLQAERSGPRKAFEIAEEAVSTLQLGTQGQNSAYFLSRYGDATVRSARLLHANALSDSLRDQVEAWLGEISPGTRIKVDTFLQMDLVQLSYAFARGKDVTSYYRASNVGFGITYTLPIIMALLYSGCDLNALLGGPERTTIGMDVEPLVLLENPEAHLHPRGQVKMGELAARAAASGIQVILETHSDHVLNGIRIAVKEGILRPEQTALHFFQRPAQEQNAFSPVEVVTPEIDADGRIDKWPEGFFDEFDNSLDKLL